MNILITGASSGIGASLAIEYSKKTNVKNIFLFGRNIKHLHYTMKQCKAIGIKNISISLHSIDVCNKKDMMDEIQQILRKINTIDIIIANAGISAGITSNLEKINQIEKIFQTNLNGVINTIQPAIDNMREKKNGHIVVMSSMASFIPIPKCPSYCASKVAVRFYAEALSTLLAKHNIKTTIVCPGYIKTPLTDANNFYMPFLMDTKKASRIIVHGINKQLLYIIFPKRLHLLIIIFSLLPKKLKNMFFNSIRTDKRK
ncbi:Short-chain dehydrogenase [Candidatus Xenohaliotis californiensis]|uniref:Short-chain dehydrogenase n=1 Tax=Candidatus Xenohaliotis californiensis TaxID=84677 RepID=A0ABM9N7I5_9RICK|nr:Short-chain dehydrogenase [Candidatus Xenohaliotis californiensis]